MEAFLLAHVDFSRCRRQRSDSYGNQAFPGLYAYSVSHCDFQNAGTPTIFLAVIAVALWCSHLYGLTSEVNFAWRSARGFVEFVITILQYFDDAHLFTATK